MTQRVMKNHMLHLNPASFKRVPAVRAERYTDVALHNFSKASVNLSLVHMQESVLSSSWLTCKMPGWHQRERKQAEGDWVS